MDSQATALRCATALEAILLRPMLASLADTGGLGEWGTGVLADALARSDTRGFAALLTAQLERR